ncbi:MAG: septal ring lytic transglycosylase RlpA family protein [Deltaproteobacteria bacterium]|nr:septal ring lytic transglycosylase RlpA family protein [Deltaproteobacteria bacterium]
MDLKLRHHFRKNLTVLIYSIPKLPRFLALGCSMVIVSASCSVVSPPPTPPHYPKPYKVFGKWYQPLPDATGFKQRGIASWYGKEFQGRKTANGEIYDMYAMTGAHKTLPLGTYVRVRNLKNNRTVEVRINDRGPFVRGRIIDLSYTAAKKIDIVGPGTAPVEVVALGRAVSGSGSKRSYIPTDFYSGNFTIQVGSFENRKNAEELKRRLENKFKNVRISVFDSGAGVFYRVRVGKFSNLRTAEEHESFLVQRGFPDAFAVAEQ